MADEPFELTIHLTTRAVVHFPLTEVEAHALGKGKSWVTPDNLTERERLFGLAYTVILSRMDKGSGEIVLTDADGRTWIIAAHSIAAAVLFDPVSKKGPRELGFRPPADV